MKWKINIVIIIFMAIAILTGGFLLAIDSKKESLNYFYNSGYIINNSYEENIKGVNKVYFADNAAYKKIGEEYVFTNTEGNKQTVSLNSFVHYSDESIMALKKGVAIDLEKIDSKLISYYNIFEGSILSKTKDGYQIKNLNESIIFQKMMFKISNNKYLIAYKDIVIYFSDDQTVNMKDYVEIEYVNENVIRIYNDESNYQTIASNLYVFVDNIKIDLEYKTISKNGNQYLTMADMVINSDDNIEILPEPEKIELPEESINGDNNNPSNGGNGGNNQNSNIDSDVQNGLDNIINKLPSDDEQIDTEDPFVQPKFKVDSLEVTTLGFENLKLTFEDESNALWGNRTVEILENSTGKVVKAFEDWEEGQPVYTITRCYELKPNTEYTINVVGQYKIEDTTYDRTFISKIFKTLDIGIEIVEDYITTDSISYAVYKNSYSEVNGFTYEITDKDGIVISSEKVNIPDTGFAVFSLNQKFKPNTIYTLIIKDIKYGDDVFLTESYQNLKLTHKTKTLKNNPFVVSNIDDDGKEIIERAVSLNSQIDKIKEEITFSIDGLNDKYGGIVEYTYNIYNVVNDTLIKTITKNNDSDLILSYDELGVSNKKVDLYFDVRITFDDNEKTIIYTSDKSNLINLSGISYPKVVGFEPSEENSFDTLNGMIVLDYADYINKYTSIEVVLKSNNPYDNKVEVKYIDNIELLTPISENLVGLPFTVSGLVPDTDYSLYVYFFTNVDNPITQGVEREKIYIGYANAKTEKVEPLYLTIGDFTIEQVDFPIFNFSVNKSINNTDKITLDNLKSLKFELYQCGENAQNFDGCKLLNNYKTQLPFDQDSLELKELITNNETINITSNNFGFYIENYEFPSKYVVNIVGIANNYEIPIILELSDGTIFDNGSSFLVKFNPIPPTLKLEKEVVLKENCNSYDCSKIVNLNDLNNKTIVAYNLKIKPIKNIKGEEVHSYSYLIKDMDGNIVDGSFDKDGNQTTINIKNKDNIMFIFDGSKLKRGFEYKIEFEGYYNSIDGEKDIQTSIFEERIYASRQPVQISGYIKSYDTSSLTFKLNIKDPDNAMESKQNIYLRNNSGGSCIGENTVEIDGDLYKFVSNNNFYGCNSLTFYENLGNDQKEHKIYDLLLDQITGIENININIDTSVPGSIKFNIPYVEDDLTEWTSSIVNSSIRDNIEKIVGLKIGEEYVELKNDGKKLYAQINLLDIINKTKKYNIEYETLEDTNLALNIDKILLVYDSGKIVDYSDENSIVFIKSKTDKTYYNNDEKKLSNKFIGSIFTNKDIIDFMSYNEEKNDDIYIIKSSNFMSYNEDSNSIGNYLDIKGQIKKMIEFNEVANSNVLLYFNNSLVEKDNIITAKNVLTTGEISTIYTTTGAEVSFDLMSKLQSNLIVELYDDNNILMDSLKCSSNECINIVENPKIVKIKINEKHVDISFDNLDKNYKYSIKYEQDNGNSILTYNNNLFKLNENILISSLTELDITNKSSKVETKYWHWTNNQSDLQFIKQIANSFSVNTGKYKLSQGERIVYSIVARKVDDENDTKVLLSDKDLNDLNSFNYNLYNDVDGQIIANLNGNYKIIVQPKIISNLIEKKLGEFSLNDNLDISWKNPGISVISNGDPSFNITISDIDGSLIPCNFTDLNEKYENIPIMLENHIDNDTNLYFNNKMYDSKSVYLELYSKNDDKYTLQGYLPIPFVYNTKYIDLSKFFGKFTQITTFKMKVKYCTINGNINEAETGDVNITPKVRLGLKTISLPNSYVLMMKNPDNNKDRIVKIEYQYFVGGVVERKVLSNIDDDINVDNNIIFTSSMNSDGTTDYYLGLDVGNQPTSTITNLKIVFYGYDDQGNLEEITNYEPF